MSCGKDRQVPMVIVPAEAEKDPELPVWLAAIAWGSAIIEPAAAIAKSISEPEQSAENADSTLDHGEVNAAQLLVVKDDPSDDELMITSVCIGAAAAPLKPAADMTYQTDLPWSHGRLSPELPLS